MTNQCKSTRVLNFCRSHAGTCILVERRAHHQRSRHEHISVSRRVPGIECARQRSRRELSPRFVLVPVVLTNEKCCCEGWRDLQRSVTTQGQCLRSWRHLQKPYRDSRSRISVFSVDLCPVFQHITLFVLNSEGYLPWNVRSTSIQNPIDMDPDRGRQYTCFRVATQ